MNKVFVNKKYIMKTATKYTCIIFSVLGYLGTFVSLSDVISNSLSFWIRMLISTGIVVLFWIISFGIIALKFSKTKWIEVIDAGNDCHVYVQYGDIFSSLEVKETDKKRNIVIPVNRCFDTIVDDDLVSSNTLHGIAIKKLIAQHNFTEESLDNAIQDSLDRQKVIFEEITKGDKRAGKLKRYPVGTIAEIKVTDDITYFLLAVSTFDYNLIARTSADEYALAVLKLFQFCNERSQQYPVVVPLIGAGLARTNRDERDILEYLIKLLKLNRELVKSDIHIVVRNSGTKTIAITEL